jgi:hypothetical protein
VTEHSVLVLVFGYVIVVLSRRHLQLEVRHWNSLNVLKEAALLNLLVDFRLTAAVLVDGRPFVIVNGERALLDGLFGRMDASVT